MFCHIKFYLSPTPLSPKNFLPWVRIAAAMSDNLPIYIGLLSASCLAGTVTIFGVITVCKLKSAVERTTAELEQVGKRVEELKVRVRALAYEPVPDPPPAAKMQAFRRVTETGLWTLPADGKRPPWYKAVDARFQNPVARRPPGAIDLAYI
jgi:hypothetical protein